ncbi:fimbrial assembly protein, partial [Klebsiella pneumoniae]
ITPPLFRLKAGEKGFVRVVRSGKKLPDDRESMLWLDIKGIPATEYVPDKNVEQFAINSKIKLIYRPAALKGNTPVSCAGKFQWGKGGTEVPVKTYCPLDMNASRVSLNCKDISGPWLAVAFSTVKIPVQG